MQEWKINIDGTEHNVSFTQNIWSGKITLVIDDRYVELKRKPMQAILGLDQAIKIGGHECRLVVIGNKADIAVDDIYVDSKEPYMPLEGMPKWNWIFIIACALLPICFVGGVIPVLIAVLGIVFCMRISITPNMSLLIRFLCCAGVSAVAWGVYYLLLFLIYMILHA